MTGYCGTHIFASMNTDDGIIVATWARNCGIPKKRLARMAKVSPRTLKNIDKPDWNPSLKTLEALDKVRCGSARQVENPPACAPTIEAAQHP